MSFLQDRQVRGYGLFLLVFVFCAAVLFVLFGAFLSRQASQMLFTHNAAMASSLLEQDVPKETIAAALTNRAITEDGTRLLAALAMDELPISIPLVPALASGGFLALLLFSGSLYFFRRQKALFLQAQQTLNRYQKGDYSCPMPRNGEGAIFQLFSSIDQLATSLQAKSEAERQVKRFLKSTVSDISHQLKTPLASLMMYQEIMEQETDQPETIRTFSARSMEALKRMERLIQAMLKLTRLDAGSIVFEKRYHPIEKLISYSIQELTARAQAEGKKIVLEGEKNLEVFCDQDWTAEAIGNLVKNALDHTQTGGMIRVSWRKTPILFSISVSDDGEGIAPEDIHHIFKRFYRSQTPAHGQGIGLGLPLAKSIAEGQGGSLSVVSVPGEGAVFTLSFLTDL